MHLYFFLTHSCAHALSPSRPLAFSFSIVCVLSATHMLSLALPLDFPHVVMRHGMSPHHLRERESERKERERALLEFFHYWGSRASPAHGLRITKLRLLQLTLGIFVIDMMNSSGPAEEWHHYCNNYCNSTNTFCNTNNYCKYTLSTVL
jgi:hypothetical protein